MRVIDHPTIRDALTVKTLVYEPGSSELEQAKTRGLPEDHSGSIRVVKMGEIDSNMCCGTHVSNLSQLQVIKLLNTGKAKQKGKIFLYFLVGNRVNQYLSLCFSREKELTGVLNGGPEYHASLAEKVINVKYETRKERGNNS